MTQPPAGQRRPAPLMTTPAASRIVVVIRHAHAGDTDPGGGVAGDHDRALDGRGRREATAAGQWFATTGLRIDLALVSSAVRTRETWERLAHELDDAPPATIEPGIYNCDLDDLIDLLRAPRAQVPVVAVVGHNPAMSELAWMLNDHDGTGLPPGAIAVIEAGTSAGIAPGRLLERWDPTRNK